MQASVSIYMSYVLLTEYLCVKQNPLKFEVAFCINVFIWIASAARWYWIMNEQVYLFLTVAVIRFYLSLQGQTFDSKYSN